MNRFLAPAGGALLAIVIVAVLIKADADMFEEDAEFSGLYETTLKDAYSRFSESDKQVAAGGPASGSAAQAVSQPNLAAQSLASRRQPGAGAARPPLVAPGKLGFGKGQPGIPLPQAGAAGAAGHQHQHDDGGQHTKLGQQYLTAKQYDQAIASFRMALQEKPDRPLAQHYIGDALRAQGKNAEAVAAYEATLRLKPNHHCCHVHIGEILGSQGKAQEAELAYAKAEQGYRQDIATGGPQAALQGFHLANFYVNHDRKLSEAYTLVQTAVAASPAQPAYLHLLARCQEKLGQIDQALKTMDQVMTLSPTTAQYQQYRNLLLGKRGAVPAASAPQPAAGAAPK